MHRLLCCAAGALLAFSAADAAAQSVGVVAGTTGIGAEVGIKVTPFIGARITSGYFELSRSIDVDDIDYDGDARLLSFGILGDVHPFAGGFRLTAGAMLNRNKVDVTATPGANVSIGGTTYTPAQIGRLDGKVDFRDIAPYAGIGYTLGVVATGLQFTLDLGVMFQGSPRVDLTASGPITQAPGFAQNLERERQELEDEIDWVKYYPVVKVGVAYRF
jgi:hypothetical protein